MFANHIINNTNIFTEDSALHQQCQNISDKNLSQPNLHKNKLIAHNLKLILPNKSLFLSQLTMTFPIQS